MHGPDPGQRHPNPLHPRIGFLKPIVGEHPCIHVGDYTYYDDPDGPEHFLERCVVYHVPFIGDRLVIGRFCAIATGVTFLMNGANHPLGGFSTYPFEIFGPDGWPSDAVEEPTRGDTVVGNDVWLGRDAVVLPGVTIGDGAIVGTEAVVGSDVRPYAIVVGNPAREVRRRFADAVVAELLSLAWWNWEPARIARNLPAIRAADLAGLRRAL